MKTQVAKTRDLLVWLMRVDYLSNIRFVFMTYMAALVDSLKLICLKCMKLKKTLPYIDTFCFTANIIVFRYIRLVLDLQCGLITLIMNVIFATGCEAAYERRVYYMNDGF